ncbi:MAG: ACT domain-containing protein [Firmicutes bacterium]|nr:ACT domain-containing protein [Bacillota bacterium]MBR3787657.1 ACT domain-containing protein [Bacillota bacterium]MBR6798461.1 ACT domain-containing protein [Bacillota bacterium]
MLVKQVSIFVENTTGRLADVTRILADAGIDLKAATIADAADFGILRCIVEDADAAKKVLNEKGFNASISEVIAVSLDNKPGGFHRVLQILADEKVGVKYIYSTIKSAEGEAVIMMKAADNDKAIEVLKANDVKLVSIDEVK